MGEQIICGETFMWHWPISSIEVSGSSGDAFACYCVAKSPIAFHTHTKTPI